MGKVLGLVTARAGSKGLIDKNIRPLAGKPLIGWTIDAARAAIRDDGTGLDRVIVSTDADRILDICHEHGAEVPFCRPAELARDDSPHLDVVLHALEWLRRHESYVPEWVMLLQPTSPLRESADVLAAIKLATQRNASAVVSVCESHAHPYLSRTMSADGILAPFMPCPLTYARRQDLPSAYAMNGAIYLVRRERLMNDKTFEPPGTIGFVMPPERSLQIDNAWDFHIAELVARDQQETDVQPSDSSMRPAEKPRRISEK